MCSRRRKEDLGLTCAMFQLYRKTHVSPTYTMTDLDDMLGEYWESLGEGEVIVDWEGECWYFADKDRFVSRIIEAHLDAGSAAWDAIDLEVSHGAIVQEALFSWLDGALTIRPMDRYGVMHELCAYDDEGKRRYEYSIGNVWDRDKRLAYIDWVSLIERDDSREPEWLHAWRDHAVPLHDIAIGYPDMLLC